MITRSSKLRFVRWSFKVFFAPAFGLGFGFGVVVMLGVVRVAGVA